MRRLAALAEDGCLIPITPHPVTELPVPTAIWELILLLASMGTCPYLNKNEKVIKQGLCGVCPTLAHCFYGDARKSMVHMKLERT